jgi:transposase-like protein
MAGASVLRYSEGFKIQVVRELESGELSNIAEANRRYGITGATTVNNWLKKYGREDILPRVIRVEKPDERDRFKQLQAENDRLKRALADEHLRASLNASWLEEACAEFGVSDIEAFKKNSTASDRSEYGTTG